MQVWCFLFVVDLVSNSIHVDWFMIYSRSVNMFVAVVALQVAQSVSYFYA